VLDAYKLCLAQVPGLLLLLVHVTPNASRRWRSCVRTRG
jgi:hypothetical protein